MLTRWDNFTRGIIFLLISVVDICGCERLLPNQYLGKSLGTLPCRARAYNHPCSALSPIPLSTSELICIIHSIISNVSYISLAKVHFACERQFTYSFTAQSLTSNTFLPAHSQDRTHPLQSVFVEGIQAQIFLSCRRSPSRCGRGSPVFREEVDESHNGRTLGVYKYLTLISLFWVYFV